MDKDDLKIFEKLDLKHPYVWLATWFGTGFLKPAPGTWGSAAAIPPALILYSLAGLMGISIGIIIVFVIGLWAAEKFDRATQAHDNKMIVIDEVAGQWLALMPVFVIAGLNPVYVFLGFLLFRLFDITKPWPISWLDNHMSGAMGVMLDDIVAGIFAALILTGILYYAGVG